MIEIVKGEDKLITLRFRDENKDPIDMSTVTEITAKILAQNGGDIVFTLTGGEIAIVAPDLIGKAQLTIDDNNSSLLKTASFTCIRVETERGNDKKINKLERAIKITDPNVC